MLSLRPYKQHEWIGHGGHGLLTGGGHTGAGHTGAGHGLITGHRMLLRMQLKMLQIGVTWLQFFGAAGAQGKLQAEACDTPASIAAATINARNLFMG